MPRQATMAVGSNSTLLALHLAKTLGSMHHKAQRALQVKPDNSPDPAPPVSAMQAPAPPAFVVLSWWYWPGTVPLCPMGQTRNKSRVTLYTLQLQVKPSGPDPSGPEPVSALKPACCACCLCKPSRVVLPATVPLLP